MTDKSPCADGTCRAPVSQRPQVVDAPDKIREMIAVKIDDHELKVPAGTTILEAARQLGVHIPTLCYHDDLCVAGVCRVCLVEVEGQKTLQASCAYPVTQPITVKTHTRRVRQARRHIIDLLLSEHYGECYSCFRNNN
ncbi:MAG: (2Fe-2S)-binding protein, partial [Candidatus Coatesbacteria bacterium]|nr:(2Fe-2S)-binding protein [Candidatus Coatesbacteria bacterium]